MEDCLACALADGREPLPGGTIYQAKGWVVEHCVGPLGLGSLIVKPRRHVTAVADLDDAEAAELGPLLRLASEVARDLVGAQQVYNCLWSHAEGIPGHIHYVVQPVTAEQVGQHRAYGPGLQVSLFASGVAPDPDSVDRVAQTAREMFAKRASSTT